MKRFCIIGVGNFGFYIARALYDEGHEVVTIDQNQERVQRIMNHCTVAVHGDATSRDFLASQGLEEMDAVVVSTGDRPQLSTLITLHLKDLEIKKILVKAVDEDHGKILRKVGASEIIYPEKDMALKTARTLSYPNILDFIPLAEEYSITEAAAPGSYIGRNLIELDLRRKFQVTVIALKDVLTDNFVPFPPPDYVIKDSDVLILLGRSKDVEKALKS